MPKEQKGDLAQSRGVQSIDVGMRILEVVASVDEPLPLKRISDEVGMTPSNVHRYLASFVRAGLLRQNPGTSRYDLGKLALSIGLSALTRIDVLELAQPELKRLASETGLLTIASVFGESGPVIFRLQQPSPPVILSLVLGMVLPLLRSPSGLVFLANLPEDTTRRLVDRELRQGKRYELAAGTPRTLAEVRETAQQVRDAGFASNDVDVSPGLRAIACPIFNLQNEIVAAISLVGPAPALGKGHPALENLMSACLRLSEETGYRPPRARA